MQSDLTFRPVESDADASSFGDLVARCFSVAPPDARAWPDMLGRENVRLLERRGARIAGLAYYPTAQHFGGRAVSCAGVAGVGVEPHERGRGVAGELMRRAVLDLSERGFALSALYPATLQLYGNAGYAIAGGRYEMRVPLRALPRDARDVGTIEPLDSFLDPRMRACHERASSTRNGSLVRNEALWMRVQSRRSITREGWALVRGGEVVAYVWFAKTPLADGHFDLDCSDLVAVDAAAARGILTFLGSYATIGAELVAPIALHDPLLEAIPECAWKIALHLPWMLRIVDVRRALEERGYAPALRARHEIAVVDPLVARNAERFVVEVADGRARVTLGGSGTVDLDVRGLAALYTGHADGPSLRSRGLAHGKDADVDAFAALCAGPAPSMADFF